MFKLHNQTFLTYSRLKNGKYRLYKHTQQATTAWRGSNDKKEVVRVGDEPNEQILTFATKELAVNYAELHYGIRPFDGDE
jgi:hypothetical protein